MKHLLSVLFCTCFSIYLTAQQSVEWGNWKNWGDQGDGTYINPIIPSDYSDIDCIRVGEDYPLAELNKRIFKSANRFVVNVVYILKDCKCTYFP